MSRDLKPVARFCQPARKARVGNADVDPRRKAITGSAMVVDDCHQGRRLHGQLLKYFGMSVSTANGGAAALEKAAAAERQGTPIDLVLMDLIMPEMDGWAATAALRAAGFKGAIIAVTGNVDDGVRERSLACGCDEFVPKPVELDDLIEAIGRALRARRGSPRRIAVAALDSSDEQTRVFVGLGAASH